MKKSFLLFAFIFLAPFLAKSFVMVPGETDAFMLAKLSQPHYVDGVGYNLAVTQIRADAKTRSFNNPAGGLNVVKFLGFIQDQNALDSYLESSDNYELKTEDLLDLNQQIIRYRKSLEQSKRIPFAALFVMIADPRYEISLKVQNNANALRTLMVSEQFPIMIDNADFFEKALIQSLEKINQR